MKTTRLIGVVSVLVASHWALAQEPPQITTQPTNATASLGATVQFKVMAKAGSAPLAYFHWHFKDAPLDTNVNRSAATRVLTLTNVTLAQDGPYFAVVTDTAGLSATSQVATLTVDPTFTKITTGPVVEDYQASSSGTWWDYDHDGFLDLLVAQASVGPATNVLYHGHGDGTFDKVSDSIIVKTPGWCDTATVGDFNNDGFIDLYVANHDGVDSLFRNEGQGRFTRLTAAQCGRPVSDNDFSFDATWVDYDGDGFLDLFTVNLQYPFDTGSRCLYRNRGDGFFVKMTANQVGPIVTDPAGNLWCSWADFDNDGYPDVWVNNWSGLHLLYHNNGNGTFSRLTEGSIPSEGSANVVGLWGDYDNDGLLDLFTPGASELGGTPTVNSLHRNLGGNLFANFATSAGVSRKSYASFGAWGDYDNDGHLDLFLSRYMGVPSVLYRNNGDGTFSSVDVGSPLIDSAVRNAPVWADYNNDGFLDLFIACGLTQWDPQYNLLYRNNGNGKAWLKLNLIGIASNRSAIGAKVRVRATIGGKTFWQMRELTGNTGASGGYGLIPHFGLGDATSVELVKIEWPSGIVQELQNVPVRQTLEVTEHQKDATPAPTLTATPLTEGAVQLTLTGPTNLRYVFEASTDLAQWTKIGVRTNLTGTVEFTDTLAAKYAQRFYRGLAP